MPRIRSVHPGLFTDESFVSVSDAAQIFYIGLLTEADDQGVFEWKTLTLKMRLRPASLHPVDGLLEELTAADRITLYEVGGRQYGAIRNFRKFQRPKYPNAIHPITSEIRKYVGLTEPISEILPDDETPIPPKAEKSPQMEDGGDSRSSEPIGSGAVAPADDPIKALWERGPRLLGEKGRGLIGKLRKEHGDAAVAEALIVCEGEHPSDPAGFLVKVLATRRKRPNGGILPNEGVF